MTTKPEAKSFDYTPRYADKLYHNCLDETGAASKGEQIVSHTEQSVHIGLASLKMQSVIADSLITRNLQTLDLIDKIEKLTKVIEDNTAVRGL